MNPGQRKVRRFLREFYQTGIDRGSNVKVNAVGMLISGRRPHRIIAFERRLLPWKHRVSVVS